MTNLFGGYAKQGIQHAMDGADYVDIMIPLRRPKGPWDERTKELIEENKARFNLQQRILNNYARTEYNLQEHPTKRNSRRFKRATRRLHQAEKLKILPGSVRPWDEQFSKASIAFNAETDLELLLLKLHSNIQYKQSKENKPFKKVGIQAAHYLVNHLILAGLIQGSVVDSLSNKMEKYLTHVSKKNAELANTIVSNTDHIPIIYAAYKFSEVVSESTTNVYLTSAAEAPHTFTLVVAAICLTWSVFRAGRNVYSRMGKNKEKEYEVLPSVGYLSGVVHAMYAYSVAKEKKLFSKWSKAAPDFFKNLYSRKNGSPE